MKKQPTINPNDFVSVESGSEDVYIPLDEEIEVYDVDKALDEINGTIVVGSTEDKVEYLDETKTDIREAIINKGVEVGEEDPFRLYAEKIGEIEGGEVHNQDKTITENGTYTADAGYTGLGEVVVEVPSEEPVLEDITVQVNGVYTADDGYDGLGEVTVDVPQVEPVLETLNVSGNGTYTPSGNVDGYDEVVVDVQPVLEDISVSENGTYTASSGYDGLGEVVVNTPVVNNEDKTIRVNGTYTAGAGYTGLGEVVVDVADIPAVVEPLSVSPTTSQQVITPPANVDGFNQVTVGAVTSSIDANISAGNIKSGVSILGVQGNVVELNADDSLIVIPAKTGQTIRPTSPYNAFSEVGVLAVTSSIDSNIQAGNIKSGVSILGVSGNVVEANETTLNITPTTSAQQITPTGAYTGYDEVNVSAVTSSIDANIVAGNIKDGVTILGVQGTYTGGGITPTGTMTITNNGIYDITNYANVDVDVPTTLPTHIREYQISSYGRLEVDTTTNRIMNFDGVKDIYDYAMTFAYLYNNVISGVIEMKDLVRLTGASACEGMCQGCHNITGVNLPELVDVDADRGFKNAFFACRGLTSVNIPKLKNVTRSNACQYMFAGEGNFNYYNISSIDISSLETVTGWYGCEGMFSHTGLVNVDFYSLRVLSGSQAIRGMLASCIYLTTVKFWALQPDGFGSYKNQFNVLLSGCSGVTVHFPSNLQSVIGSWSDVQNGFGGTNTTVLFDLPATVELVGTNSYRRNPKYDTATALGWYDTSATMATPYYTSGTTDPVVNSAIYSDASCTTQVDTIASIS